MIKKMNDSELNALFKLLADSDEFVSEAARKKLFDEFEGIETKISDAISNSDDIFFQEKASEIVQDFNFNRIQSSLYKWKYSEEVDLLRGLYFLSKFFTPDLDFQSIFSFFDKLKRKTTVDIENLTPIEQIRLLNFILYKTNKFKINFDENIFDSHLIDKATENKKPSAFLMTIIYFVLAKKFGLPIYIVRNKNILLLGYFKNETSNSNNGSIVLENIHFEFFINAADRGFILTHEDIKRSMLNLKHKLNKNFSVLTASEIINLLIDKLIFSANKQEQNQTKEYLLELKETLTIS